MWYKSHKWVMTPHTKYERRAELRVRESTHTFMFYDRRYQNIDTLKFDSDKIHTISQLSLASIIDDNEFGHGTKRYPHHYGTDKTDITYVQDGSKRISIPAYIPKDDFK